MTGNIQNASYEYDGVNVDNINRGLKAGIARKVLVGRNEPGVQNTHRQLHEVLG